MRSRHIGSGETRVRLALGNTPRETLARVAEKTALRLLEEQSQDRFELYFDTFDWRLFNEKLLLVLSESRLELRDAETGDVVEAVEPFVPEKRHWPAKEVSSGKLKARLRDITGVRALIEVCPLWRSRTAYSLRNEDDKTVLKASATEVRLDGDAAKPLAATLELLKVKGYGGEFDQFLQGLADLGVSASEPDAAFLEAALAGIGRAPDDYSPKLDIRLTADMPIRSAAVAIFTHLTDTMERNVDGIVEDIDTEFLHDFRVAVRRLRSALGQIQCVLPDGMADQYRDEFAKIGKLTNALRDLDVQLLARPAYAAMVPTCLREGLDDFFHLLQKRRDEEQGRLSKALRSIGFRHSVKRWRKFLSEADGMEPTENSGIPAGKTAAKFIVRRFKKVAKRAGQVTDEIADDELHALRVECKKLRYLLEFFISCLPAEPIIPTIAALKTLQDQLGELNDCRVLQEDLLAHLKADCGGNSKSVMAASIGVVISKAHERKMLLKSSMRGILEEFAETAGVTLSIAFPAEMRRRKAPKQKAQS